MGQAEGSDFNGLPRFSARVRRARTDQMQEVLMPPEPMLAKIVAFRSVTGQPNAGLAGFGRDHKPERFIAFDEPPAIHEMGGAGRHLAGE